MLTITETDFQRLVRFVKQNYGIDLSKKKQLILGRLSNTILSMGFPSFQAYVDHLIRNQKPEELHRDHDGKMRVAAYCRVSTDSEEQLNSYEAQKTYYTQKIQDSPDWEMAGIYADEASPAPA